MFSSGFSDVSGRVDTVFWYITALTVAFLVFITVLMVYFVVKYSRKRNPHATDIEGHAGLEITWTVVPLVLFLSMFYFGWREYRYMRTVPRDALVVKVLGKQWAWAFTYPNGKQTGELYLAVGRPVKLELTSPDVVHGFYIPAFRVKQDVVPGQTNWTWFTPERLGAYDIECTVICGVSHSYMLSRVHVIPEEEFKTWYFSSSDDPPPSAKAATPSVPVPGSTPVPEPVTAGGGGAGDAVRGEMLFAEKACNACHTVDGARLVGPTLKGLFGSSQTVLVGGRERTVTADETYLERAIRDPRAEVVKGYPPAMALPKPVGDQDVRDLAAYLKTLQ